MLSFPILTGFSPLVLCELGCGLPLAMVVVGAVTGLLVKPRPNWIDAAEEDLSGRLPDETIPAPTVRDF
jgi:hypothetical protein